MRQKENFLDEVDQYCREKHAEEEEQQPHSGSEGGASAASTASVLNRESVNKLIEDFKLYEYSIESAEILLGLKKRVDIMIKLME